MQTIYYDKSTKLKEKCVVAIGKFDGIHAGHLRILNELSRLKNKGLKSVVFTFEKSLTAFFSGKEDALIMTDKEKEEYLRDFGIDYLVIYPVNSDSILIKPEDFIYKVLLEALNAEFVVAGPDLSYGAGGKGDFALLEKIAGAEKCVKVEKILHEKSGREISSTFSREVICKGDIELASELLGRPYFVSGKVMHGRKLGRKMSFPTVNLLPDQNKLLPPFGVYFSYVNVGSRKYPGVSNVGKKPTISDHEKVCVETHILDFDDDLYGENIRVDFLGFRRSETKFESIDALAEQLKADVEAARTYFKNIQVYD